MNSKRFPWQLSLYHFSIKKKIKNNLIYRLLDIAKDDSICDVGCGAGVLSYQLSKSSNMIVGIDLSYENIRETNSLSFNGKQNFLVGSALYLPFKKNCFDKVVCTEVLEHIHQDTQVLKEIHKILKHKGIVILTTPNSKKHLLIKLWRKLLGITNETHEHVRDGYTVGELQKRLGLQFKILLIEFYSKIFVELIENFLNGIQIQWYQSKGKKRIIKSEASLLTSKLFSFYKIIYQVLWRIANLDEGLNTWGHHILIKAVKR